MNEEVFEITAADFAEEHEQENAFPPDLAAKLKRTFEVDDRIQFNMDGVIRGTGTVLGLALDHIIKSYIIMLDEPLYTYDPKGNKSEKPQRAILVSNTLMEKI
jgi:hypothetical protein